MRRFRVPKAMPGTPTPQQIWDVLSDMWEQVSPFYQSHSGDYTTTGKVHHEIVVVTATIPVRIKLHKKASDGDEVTTKQQNTGTVTFDGNGETIDGETTKTLTRYDAPHVIWTDDGDEWSII